MRLLLKVVPGASRSRISGWVGDRLKIQVSAPPERGRANAAVVTLVAETLGLPRTAVRIVSGETSPLKTADIAGAGDEILRLLPPR